MAFFEPLVIFFLSAAGWLLDTTVSPLLSFFETPTIYDESRLYKLPYESGRNSFLLRGYDGLFSHERGSFALDFNMVEGTNVLAARSGKVIRVEDSNTGMCPFDQTCSNNLIEIRHEDGTVSSYLHIQQGGGCVEVQKTVQQGDVIAKSGRVGISTGPHLHFDVSGADEPTYADVSGDGIPRPQGFYTSANTIGVNHCNDS